MRAIERQKLSIQYSWIVLGRTREKTHQICTSNAFLWLLVTLPMNRCSTISLLCLYLYAGVPGLPVGSDCQQKSHYHCEVSHPQEKESDWGLHYMLCCWLHVCSVYSCSTWKTLNIRSFTISKSLLSSNLKSKSLITYLGMSLSFKG